ncbi:hypothetical protein NY78_2130 [Desulfovibrio sp. TomC]|nr:hypothetical protein NY78_2130 [Desulfovibrio sp. TomC]
MVSIHGHGGKPPAAHKAAAVLLFPPSAARPFRSGSGQAARAPATGQGRGRRAIGQGRANAPPCQQAISGNQGWPPPASGGQPCRLSLTSAPSGRPRPD